MVALPADNADYRPRTDDGLEMGKKAVKLAPNAGTYWNTLGTAHYRAADWKAASNALKKSMDLRQGGDSFEWFFLAMSHWQLADK